ncbi:hypothetical protein J4O36_003489 [Escherichia coli]|nr:hypothetical protein [Escherichia coli]EFM3755283.1 hypothetical protein [Escherichia coli]EGB4667770.1 hypothetical protein [Escherichia coli]EHH8597563.1 hypothetical protein [Escherichia coli]EIE9916778.1 hypothetical protein [Escherichia coli]
MNKIYKVIWNHR